MADVTNPLAGAEAIASGEVIFQSRICVSSGAASFNLPFSPTAASRASLPTLNLPTLQWYLYLEKAYFQPTTGVTHNAQLNISWQPIVQISRAIGDGSNAMSLPFSAPAILPVGVPIRINIRAPVIDIGFQLDVPAQQPATISSIQFLLCASQ